MHNHLETLKYLIEKQHIDLVRRTDETKLPIHYAAHYGSTQVLKYFLQMKLHVLMTDQHGNTIAHEACERNQLECVKLICKMQRNLFETKNLMQRTPLHTVKSVAPIFSSTSTEISLGRFGWLEPCFALALRTESNSNRSS